jgi:demethylspheroidene O-methyltransferase
MSTATARISWRDRWFAWRDQRLTSPRFRQLASRFPLTRPLARRHARGLFDLVAGFVYSQWLAACVELNLFERLARSPMTAEQLAHESGLPLLSAERLLAAAVALELAQPREADAAQRQRFGLGPLGAALVGNDAVLAMVRHHQALYADLSEPLALLRRGRGGGELQRYWAYAKAAAPGSLDASTTAPYSALMSASQTLVAGQVLDAYPIGRHQHLLDLGGGEGVFVAEALARAPRLHATLFDLPAVAQAAGQRFASLGLQERARTLGGDFLKDTLPGGADVVSLVRVIYDHDDTPALALLRAARQALQPGGTLLLAEPMADTAGAQRMGDAYFGFYLLAMGSGRPRSAAQLTAMLHSAGFSRVRQVRTALPMQSGLIVARAV